MIRRRPAPSNHAAGAMDGGTGLAQHPGDTPAGASGGAGDDGHLV